MSLISSFVEPAHARPLAPGFEVRFCHVDEFIREIEMDCCGIEGGVVRATRSVEFTDEAVKARGVVGVVWLVATFVRKGRLHRLDHQCGVIGERPSVTMKEALTQVEKVLVMLRAFGRQLSIDVRDGVIVPAGGESSPQRTQRTRSGEEGSEGKSPEVSRRDAESAEKAKAKGGARETQDARRKTRVRSPSQEGGGRA